MKNVGLYAVLIQNSIQKTTWKQYGFLKTDEQINVIFALLLYVMEQSLKEENCTMDDIGAYLDAVNSGYLKKNLSYEDCRQLADFVVNVILSNEGKPMYFDGYDFEQDAYHIMHISYVENRIVYVDQEIRRTSYYLTDDGVQPAAFYSGNREQYETFYPRDDLSDASGKTELRQSCGRD